MEKIVNLKKETLKERIKRRWHSFTKQEKIVLSVCNIWLLIGAIWCLMPMWFLLINSIKDVTEYNVSAVSLPSFLCLSNFKYALSITFRNTSLIGMAINSLIFVATFSIGNIFASCMVAYALTRYHFKGRNFLRVFALVVQMIPIYGSGTAAYELLYNLGMVDNLALLWISGSSGFDYTYLLASSYFMIVSWEYAEAAFIDGAGNWYVFVRIMFPMILPPILIMWLNNVVQLWNDYMTPMLYLPNFPTLSSGIYELKSTASFIKGGMTVYFAGMIVAFVPVSILFIFLQNKIRSINLDGGLKG